MNKIYHPSQEVVNQSLNDDSPLLIMIAFDQSEIIIGTLDDNVEHNILLRNVGKNSLDIDKYFRILVDKSGADWTFACPPNYKNISDKNHRIMAFYSDGFDIIHKALKSLGLLVGINIPKRYQRHLIDKDLQI